MAAVPEANIPALVDLRQLRAEDMEPLLDEESRQWEERLAWDFRPSADLVRRFIRMQALSGAALVVGRHTVGYCYFVFEDRKGLIGDLYVTEHYRSAENEQRLLAAVLDSLASVPHVQRVESQLMMLSGERLVRLPYPDQVSLHRRNFMSAETAGAEALPAKSLGRYRIASWHEGMQEAAARLIARAYHGHVDSEINDQYRTVSGARRFLMNIVQYPGCGSFFQPGSAIALDSSTGDLVGISLASKVAFDVGHITQICVEPDVKGSGAGYALLRESMQALARTGCRLVSLTVTAENEDAVRLYRRVGFEVVHSFDAMVWDRPGR